MSSKDQSESNEELDGNTTKESYLSDLEDKVDELMLDRDEARRDFGKAERYIGVLKERISKMLSVLGNRGSCKTCRRDGYWCLTRNQKAILYQDDGRPHIIDCPEADSWRRRK